MSDSWDDVYCRGFIAAAFAADYSSSFFFSCLISTKKSNNSKIARQSTELPHHVLL
jgi:hypothetical protein